MSTSGKNDLSDLNLDDFVDRLFLGEVPPAGVPHVLPTEVSLRGACSLCP